MRKTSVFDWRQVLFLHFCIFVLPILLLNTKGTSSFRFSHFVSHPKQCFWQYSKLSTTEPLRTTPKKQAQGNTQTSTPNVGNNNSIWERRFNRYQTYSGTKDIFKCPFIIIISPSSSLTLLYRETVQIREIVMMIIRALAGHSGRDLEVIHHNWAFCVVAASLWNSLLLEVQLATSFLGFITRQPLSSTHCCTDRVNKNIQFLTNTVQT